MWKRDRTTWCCVTQSNLFCLFPIYRAKAMYEYLISFQCTHRTDSQWTVKRYTVHRIEQRVIGIIISNCTFKGQKQSHNENMYLQNTQIVFSGWLSTQRSASFVTCCCWKCLYSFWHYFLCLVLKRPVSTDELQRPGGPYMKKTFTVCNNWTFLNYEQSGKRLFHLIEDERLQALLKD